jgi:hypothetical protein
MGDYASPPGRALWSWPGPDSGHCGLT